MVERSEGGGEGERERERSFGCACRRTEVWCAAALSPPAHALNPLIPGRHQDGAALPQLAQDENVHPARRHPHEPRHPDEPLQQRLLPVSRGRQPHHGTREPRNPGNPAPLNPAAPAPLNPGSPAPWHPETGFADAPPERVSPPTLPACSTCLPRPCLPRCRDTLSTVCEFIPQMLFLNGLFGYLSFLIVFKW